MLKTPVKSIIVENRQVRGVILHDNTRIEARYVIANCDYLSIYEKMIDQTKLPSVFINKLRSLKPSMSCFAVYIGTDLPMHERSLTHENIILDSLDYIKCFEQFEASDPKSFVITIPSLTDPSIAPQGKHVVSILTFIQYTQEFPPEKKEFFKNLLITSACDNIPGLDKHILFAEAASPLTFELYTSNHKGASLGWELSPAQSGYKRPAHRSPVVRGLYHAGHWTRPGGGVYGTIVSGRQAVQLILGYKKATDFVRAMQAFD